MLRETTTSISLKVLASQEKQPPVISQCIKNPLDYNQVPLFYQILIGAEI